MFMPEKCINYVFFVCKKETFRFVFCVSGSFLINSVCTMPWIGKLKLFKTVIGMNDYVSDKTV